MMMLRTLLSCGSCRRILATAAAASALGLAAETYAQRNKITLPPPELLSLETKDGVQLRCTYYPGGVIERTLKEPKAGSDKEYQRIPGKQVVPIILLHGWSGNRGEYDFLANYLQRLGHAVIAPDLRGHGDSLAQRFPNGAERKIDRDRMRSVELQSMILDVDAVKKYLLQKNNEGELNIEMLCVVGADIGAIVAVNWAQRDWSWPQLPSFKQGRDVKALVLLSPQQSFKGLTPNTSLQHPVVASQLSVMIVAGRQDRKGYSDAKSIYKRMERLRREPATPRDRDLFLIEPSTSLTGIRLVDPRARLKVYQQIATFVDIRLTKNQGQLAWQERKNPLSDPE